MPLRFSEKEIKGLSQSQVNENLAKFGLNEVYIKKSITMYEQLWNLFKNPLIIILLIAAIISFILGEVTSALVIIVMVLFSVLLDFYQEFKTGREVQKLQEKLTLTTTVIRDQVKKEIFAKLIVPDDIVVLSAGDIVPADGVLIDADDLFVNEAALTGESLPVEKLAASKKESIKKHHQLFAGTNIVSGTGYLRITTTGVNTEFGHIAQSLQQLPPLTAFEKGVRSFGNLIVRVTIFIVLAIFLIIIIKPLLLHMPIGQVEIFQAFVFAIAVAVGLTPELLPMILSINMAKGSILMAKKGVMVKRLNAIPDFGSIDVLCTDKTGTLTEGKISLMKYLDVKGESSEDILHMVYLNSFFQTGLKNPLDSAVLNFKKLDTTAYKKIDEIPYDFDRKRLSMVVEHQQKRFMYTKGQPEEILKICTTYKYQGKTKEMDSTFVSEFIKLYQQLSLEGYKVLAVSQREVELNMSAYSITEERNMTLTGLVAFFDPPKKTAKTTLQHLANYGVEIKVITGDNEQVTQKVCEDLQIVVKGVLTGEKIEKVDNTALQVLAENNTIFARFSPQQKDRVIMALRQRGKVVGYLGDGINDAPSLKTADVGISVHNAVDVARESADIVLMHKSLEELTAGIIEGRKTFGNTMKYMMMGISSNFGNMFSLIFAVVYLPFLPMLPHQILLNNSLYDLSQVTIPTDNVDQEYLKKPKHWDLKFLKKFMFIFGSVSSLFDILTFVLLYNFFHLAAPEFQTGWFIESLATQTLVIYIIRTRRSVFKSLPSKYLGLTTIVIALCGAIIPYTFLGPYFGFIALPVRILGLILALVIGYLFLVEIIKHWFYQHNEKSVI